MKKTVESPLAPTAIGTYSQAICSGNTVYLSGQIPLDPETMQLCSTDIRAQIEQVLVNLKAVCEASGGSLDDIVKLNVYLTNLENFPLINEAMQAHFSQPYPARAAIGVNALPRNAQVEMDGILVLPV